MDGNGTSERLPMIVDLGKHRKKRIKDLRKGGGKLMEDIHDALAELRAADAISGEVQPVVVIVREKADANPFKFKMS